MQTLATITTVFAFVAIAIHVYIWIIESFLWTKPKGRETFGMTEEFAESTKEMAANQGLYNLMLAWIAATGLLAFWFGSPQVGVALLFAGLGSMAVAGAYQAGADSADPAAAGANFPLCDDLIQIGTSQRIEAACYFYEVARGFSLPGHTFAPEAQRLS